MIKEYKIIYAGSWPDLIRLVNKEIKEGWQPIGGVALSSANYSTSYLQAMIK